MTDETPVIALVGTTASGKTALALALAEQLPIEVISVDSAQVYRGMDIGTAKPDVTERRRLRHHLIDIRDPAQAYSAAEFAADAQTCIEDIRARGRLPLLVGGTLLYLKALREGLSELPAADASWRQAQTRRAQRLGWPALHAELARVDAPSAQRLNPNDGHRILRALEIHAFSGRPASELYAEARRSGARAVRVFALPTPERAELWARIERRFRRMIEQGFVDEVRRLYARTDLHPGLPSIRSVGYRQLWRHLSGEWTLDHAIERGVIATRQFAKRQQTWLRSMSDVQTLPARTESAAACLHRALCAND